MGGNGGGGFPCAAGCHSLLTLRPLQVQGKAEADARLTQQRDELEAQHRLQLQQSLAARDEAHALLLEAERTARLEAEEEQRQLEGEVETLSKQVSIPVGAECSQFHLPHICRYPGCSGAILRGAAVQGF